MNEANPRNPSPGLVRRVVARVAVVIAFVTTTMVATEMPASAGRLCELGIHCGNVTNHGNLSVRITGAWRDDGPPLSDDVKWLLPGESGHSLFTDVDGFYVPRNCFFRVSAPNADPVFGEGWHKIRDYMSYHIVSTRCYN